MTTIVSLSSSPVTASSVINRAFRIINQTASGQTPDTTETENALEALNAMIDSWRNEKLMCWANQQEILDLVSGQNSYSVGPGGDLDTVRPVRIDSAYVTYQSVSFPITLYTAEQYNAIPFKANAANFPTVLYYQPDTPMGYIWPYPIPNTTGATLYLNTWIPFSEFSDSTSSVYLPAGWAEALAWNLAVVIAPEYQQPVTKDVANNANKSKANIKRINNKTPIMQFDGTLLNNRYYNWRMGMP